MSFLFFPLLLNIGNLDNLRLFLIGTKLFFLHGSGYHGIFQLFQKSGFRRLIKIGKQVVRLLTHTFTDFLETSFLILLLHPLPFRHHILDAELSGNLLLYLFGFRHHQTDLSVIFLGKHIIVPGFFIKGADHTRIGHRIH